MPHAVIVTASAGTFPGLVEALRLLGASVEEVPLLSFAPPLDWASVDAALGEMGRYEAVVFTSPRSARVFSERAAAALAPGNPAATGNRAATVWAAGAGTAHSVGGAFGPVRLPDQRLAGERGAGWALASAMTAAGIHGPVLFPCGDQRRDELPTRLRERGIVVEEVVCYRSVLASEDEARRAAARAAVLVVASPSVAGLLAHACPAGARPRLVAVGPTTADAARAHGWPPARVAPSPTADALAAEVGALLKDR
ncbi:MAG TPA: uroporphyrinogen-III synthase [Gemmatimonadales bacterium]|nr:uroporphyrinogen-III synthase [Gemmatimonadales bacterium]